jgi:hypothetical protein
MATETFREWRIPPADIGRAQYEAVLAHPNFPAAARQLSRSMLDLAAQDAALDGIVKDVGRFTATGLAIYLDATGGLTLARLKELCALNKVTSPGRARAILLYLRFLRYIEPVDHGSRAARFVPTPALATEDTEHYPPKGEIAFSLSGLARRFRVSRPHVARLLRAAEQEGLIVLSGENRLAFTEMGRTASLELFGTRLSNDLQAAIKLIDALDAETALAS